MFHSRTDYSKHKLMPMFHAQDRMLQRLQSHVATYERYYDALDQMRSSIHNLAAVPAHAAIS